ncbi:MAG: hypothetical protein HKN14_08695 [Marinicaulis sp.]|nr:hypothetical protein [Marinicaulis sp.]NNE40982.1 hypothetical protein [Marinicaulis sp.]NNL89750.1 hypothetical protein [Marinicaulis sp.]
MLGALFLFAANISTADALAENERYIDCLNVIEADAETGRRIAQQWAATDSGLDAEHCLAVADLAAGFYNLAGLRLDELAAGQIARDSGVSGELYRQASEAWIFAENFENAEASAQRGLAIDPDSGELFLLAAHAHSAQEDWSEVVSAVTKAEDLGVFTSNGYVRRGRAYAKLGDYAAGAEDVVRALSINPMNIDAFILRGEIQQAGINIEVYYEKSNMTGDQQQQ